MAEQRSDEELMAAHCAGDRSAFRALFERYAPRLHRTLRRFLAEEDVLDVVQQTFLHLHRARNDFRPGEKLRPWLYTIAFNLKREHFRKRGRRPEAPLALDGRTDPVAPAHDPEQTERRRAARRAIAELPESQRIVIELHWLEGLPFAEVAALVGASETAVKVRAHRAYERLRQRLGPELIEEARNQSDPDGV